MTESKVKIYTRKGDFGKTGLLGGGKLYKCDPQIDSYGNVDELNSWLGLILSSLSVPSEFEDATYQRIIQFVRDCQNDLFVIGSWLSLKSLEDGSKYSLPDVPGVDNMEEIIDMMETELPALKNFIIPGGSVVTSYIHLARTVCRRAERSVVLLLQTKESKEDTEITENNEILAVIKYLNRFSDFLFVFARYISKQMKTQEIVWNPKK